MLDSHFAHGVPERRRDGFEVTPRQGEILALMAAGFTNTAIADMLRLRGKFIENQINQLYQRLQIEPGDASVQPRVRAVLTCAEKFAAAGSVGGRSTAPERTAEPGGARQPPGQRTTPKPSSSHAMRQDGDRRATRSITARPWSGPASTGLPRCDRGSPCPNVTG